MNDPFVIENIYEAPASKVWHALTDKDAMKQWYFNLEAFRPEPEFKFEFYGEGRKGEKYLHKCKITEVIPEKKLSYSWTYEGYEGYSAVTWELFPDGKQTRVKLTHAGLETFPQNNADFAKESFAAGWTSLTGTSLKKFLEGDRL